MRQAIEQEKNTIRDMLSYVGATPAQAIAGLRKELSQLVAYNERDYAIMHAAISELIQEYEQIASQEGTEHA